MYAVIRTGGKQYRVEHGDRIEVEHLGGADDAELALTPVLVVDGDTVLATPSQLGDASVTVQRVGTTKGPKIHGFTYKSKSNNRRRWGHRQGYDLIEVLSIAAAGKQSSPKAQAPVEPAPAAEPGTKAVAEKAPAKKAPAKKAPAKKAPAKKAPAKAAKTTKKAKKPAGEKTPAKKKTTSTDED